MYRTTAHHTLSVTCTDYRAKWVMAFGAPVDVATEAMIARISFATLDSFEFYTLFPVSASA